MANRRYAALTMVRDEDFYLKFWHQYYAREFGAENLFVNDHNSQKISPQKVIGEPSNIIRLPFDNPITDPDGSKRQFDHCRFKFISSQLAVLLQYYDSVVFNNFDEFFVPDTLKNLSLREYLDGLDDINIRSGVGVEIFHESESEPDLDLNAPLFEQRKFFRYKLNFCKPWIFSKAVVLTGHGALAPFHIDPQLLLLHFHFADEAQLLKRRSQRNDAFKAGRGGLRSRWNLSRATDLLQEVNQMPVHELDEMLHPEQLERMLPFYRTQLFSAENYERLFGNRKRVMEVEKFVPVEAKSQFNEPRYRFPARFKDIKI